MIAEKERKNREELFKLMQKNPDLPVVPMVDSEIVADDCGYWLGSWGSAEVDEYFISERAERVFFKSDGDVFDVLERHLQTRNLKNSRRRRRSADRSMTRSRGQRPSSFISTCRTKEADE